MKDIYKKRKETIERIFGTAKEQHGLRYTHMDGKARMEMKVGLTFACMNLKKMAMSMKRLGWIGGGPGRNGLIFFSEQKKKTFKALLPKTPFVYSLKG